MRWQLTIEYEHISEDASVVADRIRCALDMLSDTDAARITEVRQSYMPLINDATTKRMVDAIERMVPKKEDWRGDAGGTPE